MRFLVLSSHGWQDIRQRPHHLMARFAAAGHEVLWVQPRYVRWMLDQRERWARTRDAAPQANLTVKSATLVNGERLAPIRKWNQRRLRDAMGGHAGSVARGEPTILWIYNPHEEHLGASVPHDLLIYDMMDEYRGFPWAPRGISAEEGRLLAEADWVFAGTHALFEAKQGQAAGRIECILSGVEREHFAPRGNANDKSLNMIAPEAAAWRGRFDFVIGYAGMLDLRLDLALIAALAREFPRWGFMLLGPAVCELGAIQALPNVLLTGAVDYAQLPAYYHAWDAAWIPFVENELTLHINPTKILEYAAAERPIIAPALPEIVRYYADGAWLYRTHAECREVLVKLASEPELRETRREKANAWAAERDWDALAGRMLRRVETLLAAKKRS